MGLGNIISQAIIEKKTIDSLDWPRVARFAAFGYIFSVEFFRFSRSLIFFLLLLLLPGTFSSILVLWFRKIFSWCTIKTCENDVN